MVEGDELGEEESSEADEMGGVEESCLDDFRFLPVLFSLAVDSFLWEY